MGRIALAAAVLGEIVAPIHILPPPSIQHGASWAGAIVGLGGLALVLFAEQALARAGTTHRFHLKPTVLVTHGPYRFSRNPFYLGFMLFVGGLLLMLSMDWLVVALPAWFLAMNHWPVPEEERGLEQAFGADWQAYAARVRRWL